MVPPLAGRAGRYHLGRPAEALGAPPTEALGAPPPRRWALRRRGGAVPRRPCSAAARCRAGRTAAARVVGVVVVRPPRPAVVRVHAVDLVGHPLDEVGLLG